MLCSKSPWPKYEGGPIAMYAMITGLQAAGHTVKVLAANTNKYTVDPETIPADFKEKTQIEFVDLDLSISVFGAACNFLSRKSYHISRFHTKAIANKLTHTCRIDIPMANHSYEKRFTNALEKRNLENLAAVGLTDDANANVALRMCL